MWFIGVEVEQETSAPPPKKNPGSAPDLDGNTRLVVTIEVALRYDSDAALNCTFKVRACAQGIFN